MGKRTVTIGRGHEAKTIPVVWRESTFGDVLEFPMPGDTNVIILCVSDSTGMKPAAVKLPHQIYRETLAKYGNDVVLVPAKSEDYIHVLLED